MVCEIGPVFISQQVTEALPRHDIEPVTSGLPKLDEHNNETFHWARLALSDDLSFVVKLDVAILCDVAELPRGSTTCLHLNGDVTSLYI